MSGSLEFKNNEWGDIVAKKGEHTFYILPCDRSRYWFLVVDGETVATRCTLYETQRKANEYAKKFL